MYAIKLNDNKNGTSRLLVNAFNTEKKKPVMTFNTREEAEENMAYCIKAADEDELELTFEVIEYEQ